MMGITLPRKFGTLLVLALVVGGIVYYVDQNPSIIDAIVHFLQSIYVLPKS